MKNSKWVKRMKETFPFALFLSFTFGFFGPIQLYITNVNEYWFSIWDILWPCALCTVVTFAVILCIGALLPLKGRKVYFGLLFGLALALYLQGNFINTDYGVLDGTAINWDEYADVAIWNTALWVSLIFIPVALMIFKTKISYKITKWVSVYIVAIQVLTLGFLAITTDLEKDNGSYLSTKGLYEISAEENIIVFILDAFDDMYFKELYEEETDFFTPLDGFTHYSNNTGMYPTTKGALPYILTGQKYFNEKPYDEYIEESWNNATRYIELTENGYEIGIYTGDIFVDMQKAKDKIMNIEEAEIVSSSDMGLSKTLYKLTSFRYAPHVLKDTFWFYSGEFDNYKQVKKSDVENFTTDNLRYYNGLCQNGLTVKTDSKQLKFIHLEGTHVPYTYNEDLIIKENVTTSYLAETKACMKIMYEYIKQLKDLNIYDNTTIMIIADHGAGTLTNPILLMKPQDTTGVLKIQNTPVSQDDLWATIMDEAGLNKEKYGMSIFDVTNDMKRERRYIFYSWDNSWFSDYLPTMKEYKIDDDSNDLTSFHLLDAPEYQLGTELYFTEQATAEPYIIWGMGSNEKTHTWSSGKKSNMSFKLLDCAEKDIEVEINLRAISYGKQFVNIYANNNLCYSGNVETNTFSFVVPKEFQSEDGYLELLFEFPDAISPASLGQSADVRELALAFTSMIIEEVE